MASEPYSLVQLSIECNRLSRADVLSKSDPLVVCYDNTLGSPTYLREIGRTECIRNDQNPRFAQRIGLKYYFEKNQKLLFRVLDSDSSGESTDSLGEMTASLSEIVGAKNQQLARNIEKGSGVMIVQAEIVPDKNFDVSFRISGHNLDKKDFFGSSDPFVVISRDQNGVKKVVHRTEVIKNNLNPTWLSFDLPSVDLCSNNFDQKLIFECFDWDSDGSHDLIGSFTTTLNELKEKKSFGLVNPKKSGKKDYKNSGTLDFDHFESSPTPNFLDYLRGGSEISLMVAIDFTGSNGSPKSPTSLHYRNPTAMNEYQQAIIGVGSVVEPYDYDRQFPVFGFGAKLLDGRVHHDFHCNMNPENPNVFGVPGILDAYNKCLDAVELYGPTNFAPIIEKASKIAGSHSLEEQKYYILLMLTDGEITDMDETIKQIVRASDLPLSIIIVGVGSNDFESMKTLDGDDKGLSYDGKKAVRDIVQFVPFRSKNGVRTPEGLAEEVLGEVPRQFLSYMKSKRLKPKYRA